jgi:predicted phosphodiesterase
MTFSRRTFLRTTAAGALALARAIAADPERFGFFVIGDTHYRADLAAPGQLDPLSAVTTTGLVERLNALPGTAIPEAAGGGRVLEPRGLIHAGDLIDSGDKTGATYLAMQQTEWAAYARDFSPNGEGTLKLPVYEVWGNHDAPRGQGLVLEAIARRTLQRPSLKGSSAHGLHYSWDWGGVHFVNLGLIVGSTQAPARPRRYAALDSLRFLLTDLAENVGDSGRPVIVTHHVDVARYILPAVSDAAESQREWDSADVRAYYEALAPFNIAAIFYGHTHARVIFRWDGGRPNPSEGIPVFNVDNASHFKSEANAFYYVEAGAGELLVREYATADRWRTAAWTPQAWRVPLKRV